jgi:LysM repeat protein
MTVTHAPGTPSGALPPSVLQAYANARLLLYIHQLPGRFDSPRLGRMVCEAFLKRGRMVGESSSGLGIDSGDFTYGGYLCRSAVLDPMPSNPWDWLSADLAWSETGYRPALADGRFCEAPAQGAIWLGSLPELQSPGVLPPLSRGQLAGLTVTEFAGPFGAGGIGSLAQPLLGERLELVLKPNRIAVVQAGDTLLSVAERYGTTVDTLRSLNSDISATTAISTTEGDTLNSLAQVHGTTVSWLRDQPQNAWLLRPEGHTVAAGETLTSVAQLYGTTRTTLRKLNPAYSDFREWPGDAPLPLGELLNLFAIRPSSPLPAGEALVVPLYRPSTPLPASSWLFLPRRRAAASTALEPDL